jgi:mannose-6-phosphate isomerase
VPPSGGIVGESWEVSVEPSFPSTAARSGQTLRDIIAGAPLHWLGAAVSDRYHGQTPLLVKLLDTSDNLSVQVHPDMDDRALAEDESGKPESWIVLEAEPGAGVYLGLRDGVTQRTVEECLDQRGPLDELLNFVPCRSGDAFIIRPGTVHAIGGGITLLEPQHVAPGKKGLTYRFWDWNRLYDSRGKQSPTGSPRQLHVDRSVAVTNFSVTGDRFVESCRAQPVVVNGGPLAHRRVLECPYFETEALTGTGCVDIPVKDTMVAITFVGGTGSLETAAGTVEMERGRSAVVPAAAGEVRVAVASGECYLSWSKP